MLDTFTRDLFTPLLGQRFRVHLSPEPNLELELIEVTALPTYPPGKGAARKREPFSLLFRGPREFVLPQRITALEQETLGRVEIFLVPIGPDETGQRYEAIFN